MVALPQIRQAQFDSSGVQGILERNASMRKEMLRDTSMKKQMMANAKEKQRGIDDSGREYVAGAIGQIQNEEEFGKLGEVVGNMGVSPHLMEHFNSYDRAEWEAKGPSDIAPFIKFRDSMSHWMTTGKEKKYATPDTKKKTYWNDEGGWTTVAEPEHPKAGEVTKAPEGYPHLSDPTKEKKGGGEKGSFEEKGFREAVADAEAKGEAPPTKEEFHQKWGQTPEEKLRTKEKVTSMKSELLDGGKDEYDTISYDFNTTNKRNEVAYWDTVGWNETKVAKIPKKVGLTPANIQELSDTYGHPVEDVLKAVGAIKGNPPSGVKSEIKDAVQEMRGQGKRHKIEKTPLKKLVIPKAQIKDGWTPEKLQVLMKDKAWSYEQALEEIK